MKASLTPYDVLFSIIVSAALLAPAISPGQTPWKPEKSLELVVGSAPGTGTDKTARMIQKIWQEEKALDVPSVVVNKPGGGGAVSWAYLNQRQGDAHSLLVTSYNIVTNHITGKSPLTYTDFTPIALLISEYIAFSVKADSSTKTVHDVITALKKDPRALSVGLSSSIGGANHIALGLLMKAVGVDVNKMRVVVFNSGGESMTALLGGHVDMMVASGSAIAPQVASGSLRALAFAAPSRIGGPFATVPTLAELGLRVTADNWRIVIAPKGITAQQTAYWDAAFRKLASSTDWKRELESNYLSNNYLDSTKTRHYLDVQYNEVKSVLTELGLAKSPTKP
jgi:putative tricarboxylic transport membrane protein